MGEITSSTFKQLISELHAAYGGFECAATESGGAVITGPYALDAAYKGIRLAEDFELQLTIPKDYPQALPKVKELTSIIDPAYEHLFADRSFCLGVQGELLIAQLQDPSRKAPRRPGQELPVLVSLPQALLPLPVRRQSPWGKRSPAILQ